MKVATLILIIAATTSGRIVSKDELSKALRANGIKEKDIKIWQCIVKRESNYDTAAYNSVTKDHGIFQISQIYWCSPPGTGCKMRCSSLRDEDIDNDIKCAKIIYKETKKDTGNGFDAWVVYKKYCKNV